MMVPKISAQFFSHSLLTGTFALISIGNAIASEIPTVQVSAVDRQSELLADSTDDSIAKIGGIYPINTLLNPDSAPATSNLALARRKKRINTKPQIKREGSNSQPQIQNTPVNTAPQIQNPQINTPPQVQNTPINIQPQVQNPQINTPPPMPSGLTATQNQIQYKRNDFGFAAQFGNGTSIGIQGKLGLTDNISIRPEFFFGSGGGELENQQTSVLQTNQAGETNLITPNIDNYKLTEESILTTLFTTKSISSARGFTTNVPIVTGSVPFLNSSDFTIFGPGTIFPVRTVLAGGKIIEANVPSLFGDSLPAGATIPAGTIFPENVIFSVGTVFEAGTVLPANTSIFTRSSTDPQILSVVKVDSFARNIPLVLTADYKIISSFTPNVAIGNNPAGSVIKAGTILPSGTIIPANTAVPVDSRNSNTIPVAIPLGAIKSKITKSTSLGLAVTYDFKLDPQGKSTAYLGPKVAFTSTVGEVDLQPGITSPLPLNANETKIGLVAGIDYVLFDGFTIGANANYYFSRNLSGSVNSPTGTIPFQSAGGGSSTDFGLRIGYQF